MKNDDGMEDLSMQDGLHSATLRRIFKEQNTPWRRRASVLIPTLPPGDRPPKTRSQKTGRETFHPVTQYQGIAQGYMMDR